MHSSDPSLVASMDIGKVAWLIYIPVKDIPVMREGKQVVSAKVDSQQLLFDILFQSLIVYLTEAIFVQGSDALRLKVNLVRQHSPVARTSGDCVL